MEQNKKPKLFMLVGLSGGGQDEWADEYLKKTGYEAVCLLRDPEWDGWAFKDDRIKEMCNKARKILDQGNDVIINGLNLRYRERRNILAEIGGTEEKIAVVFATPLEECEDKGYSHYELFKQMQAFTFPCEWEGFDAIHLQRDPTAYKWVYPLHAMEGFPQHNPSHAYDLGKHCRVAMEFLQQEYGKDDEEALYLAALYHDYGKLYTKNFRDTRGNYTPTAHFYGHHSVGAYMLAVLQGENLPMKVYQYITYHMEPFFFEKDKTKAHYKRVWGEDFYNQIMKLHAADLAAH